MAGGGTNTEEGHGPVADRPGASPEARPSVLDELRHDPRPAVHRAALAAAYPSWGLATMSLLVVGLLVGFASMTPLGNALDGCVTASERLVCQPFVHAVVFALPVAALIAGLAVSLVGGRLLLRWKSSPLLAAVAGWVLFLAGTTAAYLLAGAS